MKVKASGGWCDGEYLEASVNAAAVFVRRAEHRGLLGKYVVAHDGWGGILLMWDGEVQDPPELA